MNGKVIARGLIACLLGAATYFLNVHADGNAVHLKWGGNTAAAGAR